MKKPLLASVLLLVLSSAHALGGDSPATDWPTASESQKDGWLSAVVRVTNPDSSYKFTTEEVSACLNTLLKPPLPPRTASMSLGAATAGCMALIKNR